jgi:hypothetical protein
MAYVQLRRPKRGARVVALDCPTIERAERGFLQALTQPETEDEDERVVVDARWINWDELGIVEQLGASAAREIANV